MIVAGALLFVGNAGAQEQQAGNEASVNAEETFQRLIEQCDNTDALMMRARIRLLLGRIPENVEAEAQRLLDEGFAACGEGDMETAMAKLEQSLEVADAGVDDTFGGGNEEEVAAADEPAAEGAAPNGSAEEDRPWWKFW
jgi:hypothetical protein